MDRFAILLERLPFKNVRMLRYLISGGIATATNLCLLYVLVSWAGIWYLFASVISLSVATIVSFVLQKLWTFRNYDASRVHVQFPLHLTLALTNIALNTMLLYVLVEWLRVWYLIAQVLVGGCLACMNYAIYKHVIFRG